jgi:hypothetical protein
MGGDYSADRGLGGAVTEIDDLLTREKDWRTRKSAILLKWGAAVLRPQHFRLITGWVLRQVSVWESWTGLSVLWRSPWAWRLEWPSELER